MSKTLPIFADAVKGTEADCRKMGGKPRKGHDDFLCTFRSDNALDKLYRAHKIVKENRTQKIVATAVLRNHAYTFFTTDSTLSHWFKRYNTKIGKPSEDKTASGVTIVFYERPYKPDRL